MSISQPSTSPAEAQVIDTTSSSPRPRKRPLRTYGRQSSLSKKQTEPEPITKRRKVRLDENAPATHETEQQLPLLPAAPPSSSIEIAQPPKPQGKRHSILTYFKPRPCVPTLPSSDPVDRPPSPPPSSPPRRTRRRLTTRLSLPVPSDPNTSDVEEEGMSTIIVKDASEPLSEVPLNTTYINADDKKRKRTPKATKKERKELVQTVLSLSINKEPGFLICNECGILYNPLNGEDRKEHGRRHKAFLKEKKRRDGESGSLCV
ncbi:hypothetical protein QBC43DRAFT_322996 [Cladorrhinum sp. PSN259]|nr:hypothetical protein QBC43DRAFT_322996 [Cladorrhinum sp. PSN259]